MLAPTKINSPAMDALLIATIAFVFVLMPLGMAPLFDKDEGAFCEATREMIASGDYLMTYLNGAPRYDKPILIYWLQAVSVHTFGLSEFALRLPSAIAAMLWSLITYRFARRVISREAAFIASLAILTALQPSIVGKAAIADALLNLLIAGSMFALYDFYETRLDRHLYAAVVFIALGTLTKGPIAILIPFLSSLVFCLTYRRFDLWKYSMSRRWAWILYGAIVLPWPIAAYIDQGNDLLFAWVMEQTVYRAAKPLEGHGGSLFYYIPVMLLGTLPLTAPVLGVLWNARTSHAQFLDRFLLVWFLTVFVMFSLLGTKLPHYVVYGYTPLFILAGRRIAELRHGASLGIPAAALSLLVLALPFLVPMVRERIDDSFAVAMLSDLEGVFPVSYFLTAGLASALGILACFRYIPPRARLVAACIAVSLSVNFAAVPAASRLMQEPVRDAALLAREKGWDVVLYDFKMPSFLFYREALAVEGRLPQDGEIVVTKMGELQKLQELGAVTGIQEMLYEKRGIVMARVSSAIK
ncbi:MAG: Undecaprenyl phosphate-alpha-4-amino-4-deoxy-L-arabinose arabinosyl transferase [Candidatus Hydrogenedentota bacterium]|jgi:4-amino-4-deoxy-L-arabinose transferase-like glycosyltransferase